MLPAADEGTHELETVENCDCTKGELTQSVGDEPWLLGKNGEDRRRSKRASSVHEGDDDEERARTAARTVWATEERADDGVIQLGSEIQIRP